MNVKCKPALILFSAFLFVLNYARGQEEKPNILFILTDDQAYGSMGCTGNSLVQTIDVAPTLLELAGVDPPASYQGRSLLPLLSGDTAGFRKYLYTENLWSTHFGNPRCESVQDRQWKYLRYYKNDNISARAVMNTAKEMDIPVNKMLYEGSLAGADPLCQGHRESRGIKVYS